MKIKNNTNQTDILSHLEDNLKSRKMTSLEEFSFVNQFRPEEKAGFKCWLHGSFYHFDDEWLELYKSYQQRKLNDRR